ncbi:hypothetical protein PXW85_26730, partial [Klebsiella pneumoniae]|uniref:alpha-amylase family glycosyl hydrolase n=1 Tax=Klebsiella pneumoniae TaxID=573 RepID=UPI0023816D9E
GIIIASRKQNEREISVPAAISAYLGVTEPAMYGINLKYRFPMPWHAGENGGFSDGEPWIGLGDNYQEINVEAALADPDSVFY